MAAVMTINAVIVMAATGLTVLLPRRAAGGGLAARRPAATEEISAGASR